VSSSSLSRTGFWLVLDQILAIVGGGIFWLIIANLATPNEIGKVSAILGLAVALAGFGTFGIEFVILREASQKKSELLSTFFVLQLLFLGIISPISFFVLHILFPSFSEDLISLGFILLISLGLWEFAMFSVIGLLRGKTVALVHTAAVAVKMIVGIFFVVAGFGSAGILLAIILQIAFSTTMFLLIGFKEIGFHLGSIKKALSLIKLALSNYVNKIARIVVTYLTFLILPAVSLDLDISGVFFIQYTIALVLINSVSVLAVLSIAGSKVRNKDISPISTRLGLYAIAPIIAIFLTVPSFILQFFGDEYALYPEVFRLLIISVIPAVIVWNFTSHLNTASDKRGLVILGVIQLTVFSLIFVILHSQDALYGITYSVLGAFSAGAAHAFIVMRSKIISLLFSQLLQSFCPFYWEQLFYNLQVHS